MAVMFDWREEFANWKEEFIIDVVSFPCEEDDESVIDCKSVFPCEEDDESVIDCKSVFPCEEGDGSPTGFID
jgi:hypothetical protein